MFLLPHGGCLFTGEVATRDRSWTLLSQKIGDLVFQAYIAMAVYGGRRPLHVTSITRHMSIINIIKATLVPVIVYLNTLRTLLLVARPAGSSPFNPLVVQAATTYDKILRLPLLQFNNTAGS